MKKKDLSILEAYKAMFFFLENLYNITQSDDLGSFLGSMQIIKDGKPMDQAYWEDWLRAIEKVVKKNNYKI